MEFEELAVNYLDNDISESEMSELNRYFSLSPGLKDEVYDIAHIRGNLIDSKIVLQDSDLLFLGDFGSQLTSTIANNHKNMFSDIFLRNKKLSLLLLLLISFTAIVPSYFLFFKINSGSGTASNINHNANKNVTVSKEQSNGVSSESYQITQTPSVPAQKKNGFIKPNPVRRQRSNELSGKITESNTASSSELIQTMQKELAVYRSNNDLLNQAITEKRLGILFRDNHLSVNEAETYLNKALAKFIKLNRPEQQAETLGEIGKLEFLKGNKSTAQIKYQECLNLLKSLNSPKYGYWEKIKDKHN